MINPENVRTPCLWAFSVFARRFFCPGVASPRPKDKTGRNRPFVKYESNAYFAVKIGKNMKQIHKYIF
jgi:hypothetical protein